jgi:hypothetical protein
MADHKETNPKDGAATTRLQLDLFPDSARAYGALAFVEGDQKYGAYNWRVAGVRASVYVAALGRHMAKWWAGEDCDPATHVPHLANAIACIAVLIDATEQGNMVDDRPPAQPTELYSRFEEVVRHLHTTFPRRVPRYTAAAQPTIDLSRPDRNLFGSAR